jgi:NADPH:quinone reductase
MKALLCREFGPLEGLALEEVSSPIAGNGQVVVCRQAAGVNFPDTLIVQGKYQIRPSLPFHRAGSSPASSSKWARVSRA